MNQTQTQSRTAEEAAPDGIEVWVCPNCGHTFHSASAGDLSVIPNIRTAMRNAADEDPAKWGSTSGYRSECQMCKHGIQRERVIYVKASAVKL